MGYDVARSVYKSKAEWRDRILGIATTVYVENYQGDAQKKQIMDEFEIGLSDGYLIEIGIRKSPAGDDPQPYIAIWDNSDPRNKIGGDEFYAINGNPELLLECYWDKDNTDVLVFKVWDVSKQTNYVSKTYTVLPRNNRKITQVNSAKEFWWDGNTPEPTSATGHNKFIYAIIMPVNSQTTKYADETFYYELTDDAQYVDITHKKITGGWKDEFTVNA